MENTELIGNLRWIREIDVVDRSPALLTAINEAIRLLEWLPITPVWPPRIGPPVDLLFNGPDCPKPYRVADCWTRPGDPVWYCGINWASRRVAGQRATDAPIAWRPSE